MTETQSAPNQVFGFPAVVSNHSLRSSIERIIPYGIVGHVRSVRGTTIIAENLPVPIGSIAIIQTITGQRCEAEVIGFDAAHTILAPLDTMEGVRTGDPVELHRSFRTIRVSDALIGRVLDATGQPIDDGPIISSGSRIPCDVPPLVALSRPPIRKILPTQIRAIDSMLTVGEGQRIGIFSGSGVGKSTLLGMLARGTSADCVVIGLIGERGREVREFLEQDLGEQGKAKSITVVATSDQPAPRRILAAKTATAIAESLRDQGKSVLLLMDSVTRFAMAQREIGLAAGEAPTTRGYPPSVFSMLPQLVERAGLTSRGSITAFYTVLVEGDDANEPISDSLRGLLDGHFYLSRDLASYGQYPAIDILPSLSRLQTQLVTAEQRELAGLLRHWMAVYRQHEDLIQVGAYKLGNNPGIDRAIDLKPQIERFLKQSQDTTVSWEVTLCELKQLLAPDSDDPSATRIN
jgi:flagellum-specific ATP synthase